MEDDTPKSTIEFVHECVKEFDDSTCANQWRDEAREAYDFEAGRQWPDDDLKILQDQKRPPVVFNEYLRFLDAVVGFEINNKQEHKFLPAGVEDKGAIDAVNETIRQRTDELSANCSTQAFRDAVNCGMGWTSTVMSYQDDFEGIMRDDRMDPLCMGWDMAATKPDLGDGKYRFCYKRYSDDEIVDRWGKEALSKIKESATDTTMMEKGVTEGYTFERTYHFDDKYKAKDLKKKPWPVVWFQWSTVDTKYMVQLPGDQPQQKEISEDEFKKLKKQIEPFGIELPSAKIRKTVYRQIYVCGETALEKETEIPYWTMLPITGKYDANRGYWFGMARVARDPQMWANKYFSTIMHNISTSGRGLMMEEDAVGPKGVQDLENDWARADKIKIFAEGALSQGKVKVPDPAPLPHGVVDMMSFSFTAIQQTLGLSVEFMGLAGRTQAGVVEESRRSASVGVLAPFFDSRRSHVKRTGRLKLAFACKYFPDSVFVEVGGPEMARHLPAIRSSNFMKADVKVDEVAMAADQRAAVWSMIVQMLPLLQGYEIPPTVMIALMRYSPLPASLLDKIEELLSGPPDKVAEMMKELEVKAKQAQITEDQSKAVLNFAKAKSEGQPDISNLLNSVANAQTTKLKMDAERQKTEQKMALNNQTFSQDMMKASQQEKR